ncbi:MAG: acyl-CoA thioesterase [Rhodocyclaceae bacterium]|nr:acyl-CoA thioesterase [Rhodocyclaceae bacterium]
MSQQNETRGAYPHFLAIPTRWTDNDAFGQVNNVVYYSYFDTAINSYLMHVAGVDARVDRVVGQVVESSCRYHRAICFPEVVDAGLRVGHLGNASVRYEVGLFRHDEDKAAASGYFVHVFVDRVIGKPAAIPPPLRACLERLRP